MGPPLRDINVYYNAMVIETIQNQCINRQYELNRINFKNRWRYSWDFSILKNGCFKSVDSSIEVIS